MRASNPIVIHYVFDMARAIGFYREVFDVQTTSESPGWSTLDFGNIELALHITSPKAPESDQPLPHAGLNLQVFEPIEAVQRDIEARGGALVELREPDDFVPVRVAMFKDSEGNGFELRQLP